MDVNRAAENLRPLDQFFAPFVSLPFNHRCADAYGRIRADLERAVLSIGPYETSSPPSLLLTT